jgi:hypothetical protein
MNTPTFHFAKHESAVRRLAAALAVVVTFGVVASVGEIADRSYDGLLMAQADAMPTQVVVITAKRPRA